MDPTVRGDETGNYLSFGINGDRRFEKVFAEFPGSFWKIMAAISAGKPGWIDCGYRDFIVTWVEQVHRFLERQSKIQRFDPTEKFLERGEVGDGWEVQDFLNVFHIPDIINELPIMLVPEVLEENEKLILGIRLLRVLAGIWLEVGWLYNRCRGLDKPDIPARWPFSCLLTIWTHILVRRRSSLDLSVAGIISS